jgi:hypothetical protein
MISVFYGVPPFFGTMVCIACSQFQKLRSRLLAIGQKKATHEKGSAAECDRTEEKGEIDICQEMFSVMQEKLNECVSHHRLIIE